MLVQCPGCKTLLELTSFTAEGGVLSFGCPSCSQFQRIQSGTAPSQPAALRQSVVPTPSPLEEAAAPAPTEPPAPSAADAVTALPDGAVAPKPSGLKHGADLALWVAWDKLCMDWGNPRGHEQFVALCASATMLPFAGTRYREHLLKAPKDPLAAKGRDRVLAQAMAMVTTSRGDEAAPRSGSGKKVLAVVAIVVSSGILIYIMRIVAKMMTLHSTVE